MAKKKTPRKKLNKDAIVATALQLIDELGLESFNFRLLAKRLGCGTMSVYTYFPSKAHLFDALVDHCLCEVVCPAKHLPWVDRLKLLAAEYCKVPLRHPGFFPFFATYQMNSMSGAQFVNEIFSAFDESGLPPAMWIKHYRAISYFLTGYGIEEAKGFINGPSAAEPVPQAVIAKQFPIVAQTFAVFDQDRREHSFDLGFQRLLDALAEEVASYSLSFTPNGGGVAASDQA
jgi:AcrR family transcriptional regulator